MSNQNERGRVIHLPDRSDEDVIIRHALEILESRCRVPEWYVQNADEVKNYLRVRLATEHGRECLLVLFLDAQNGLIDSDLLYQGGIVLNTFRQRVIVQRALACNAKGVVIAHNHPDGSEALGRTDQYLLSRLMNTLGVMDITVRDYFLVGNEIGVYSFYEHGRI